jgi:hypothetical protein
MYMPSADLVTDFLYRILRDSRTETTEELALAIDGCPRPERIPQEVELLVWVALPPIGILAVDQLRLLRMQLQTALL